jgi:NPCBM/NEW2 domain.
MWECQICKKHNVDKIKRCVICSALKPGEKKGEYAEVVYTNPVKSKTRFTYMFFIGLLIILVYFNFSRLTEFGKDLIQIARNKEVPAAQVEVAQEVKVELASITPVQKPSRYFINKWNVYKKEFSMYLEDKECLNAIGIYIPSREMKKESQSTELVFQLNESYFKMTFDLGCDSKWSSGAKCGTYSVGIYVDDSVIWESGVKDRNFYEKDITVKIPAGARMLKFILTEKKGKDGTQNIVIGYPMLYSLKK